MRRRSMTGLTVSVLAVAAIVGAPQAANATPCGYFGNSDFPGYNHCATNSHVIIKMDYSKGSGMAAVYKCVGPGTTGLPRGVVNAYYIGQTC